MSDDKSLPFARGTLPHCDRFTVSDALDLMAGVVCPVDWGDDNLKAHAHFAATRDHHHRHKLQRAIDAGQVEVFDTHGQRLFPMSVAALEDAIIMRDDLQRFARDALRIELVHEAAVSETGGQSGSQTSTRHTLKRLRRDSLTPLIEQLVRAAADPSDYASIWNRFVALADADDRPDPLLGAGEGEVRYRNSATEVGFIKRDAFIKRLKRRAD